MKKIEIKQPPKPVVETPSETEPVEAPETILEDPHPYKDAHAREQLCTILSTAIEAAQKNGTDVALRYLQSHLKTGSPAQGDVSVESPVTPSLKSRIQSLVRIRQQTFDEKWVDPLKSVIEKMMVEATTADETVLRLDVMEMLKLDGRPFDLKVAACVFQRLFDWLSEEGFRTTVGDGDWVYDVWLDDDMASKTFSEKVF